MYAIVEIAGQQFKVEKDQQIYVHRLDAKQGSKVSFDKVLLLDNNGKVDIGLPEVKGMSVTAKVMEHLKGDKVVVFKKKRRKGYQVKNGHRQYLTQIEIDTIVAKGAKKSVTKAEVKKEVDVVETTAPRTAKVEAKTASTDLSGKTVAELKELAKTAGITGISAMKKADLIEALSK